MNTRTNPGDVRAADDQETLCLNPFGQTGSDSHSDEATIDCGMKGNAEGFEGVDAGETAIAVPPINQAA